VTEIWFHLSGYVSDTELFLYDWPISYFRQRQARNCHCIDEARGTAVRSPRVPSHYMHGYEVTTSDRAAHDNFRVGSQRDTGNWLTMPKLY